MTALALAGIAVAGALGAPARYLVDGLVQDRTRGPFPWGTFVVNVTGSFVLGVVTALALHHGFGGAPRRWLATGLCGSFTTFSTFSWETVRLLEEERWATAAANAGGSVAAGLLAAAAGMGLVALIG